MNTIRLSPAQEKTLQVMLKWGNLVCWYDGARMCYRLKAHPQIKSELALAGFWNCPWITVMKLWELGAIYAVETAPNTCFAREVALHAPIPPKKRRRMPKSWSNWQI